MDPFSYYLGLLLGFLVGIAVTQLFPDKGSSPPEYLVFEDEWAEPVKMTESEYRRYLSKLDN